MSLAISSANVAGQVIDWVSPLGGSWQDGANWSQGIPNGRAQARFLQGFPEADQVVQLDAPVSIGTLLIENAGRFKFDGNELELLGDDLMSPVLSLASSDGQVTLANRVRVDGSQPIRIDVAGSSTLQMTQAVGIGDADLVKTGTGNWVFAGMPTDWKGQLVVEQGVAEIDSFGSLGATGDFANGIRVLDAATLRLRAGVYPLEDMQLSSGTLRLATDSGVFLSGRVETHGVSEIRTERADADARLAGPILGDGELRLTGPGTLILQQPSEFQGTLRVAGRVRIEHGAALGTQQGTLDDATYVDAGGELSFAALGTTEINERMVLNGGTLRGPSNRSVLTLAGPIDVQADSTIMFGSKPSQIVVTGELSGAGNLHVVQTDVELAAPSSFNGTIHVEGSLAVSHSNALTPTTQVILQDRADLIVKAPTTVNLQQPLRGGIVGEQKLNLTSDALVMADAELDFRISAPLDVPQLVQRGAGISIIDGIGRDSTAELLVEFGYARVSTPLGLGTADTPTRVESVRDAVLQVSNGNLLEDVYLNNATGFRYRGALEGNGTIRGNVHLGDVGSIIGGSETLTVQGAITGGDLTALHLALESDEHTYTGQTVVGSHAGGRGNLLGELILRKQARLATTSSVQVLPLSRLVLDRTFSEQNDALADQIPVTLSGGAIAFLPHQSRASAETIGPVHLDSGAASIGFRSSGGASAAQSKQISLTSLDREPGSGLSFFNTYVEGGLRLGDETANAPRILIDSISSAGIIGGWATVGQPNELGQSPVSFAWYDPQRGVHAADPAMAIGQLDEATSNDHVIVSDPQLPLTADRSMQTLASARGQVPFQIDLGQHQLNVSSGGLIVNRTQGDATISNGTLTGGMLGAAELFFHVTRALNVSATIADHNGDPVSIVKLQQGDLTLSGENYYSGTTYVQSGTLRIVDRDALPGNSPIEIGGGTLEIDEITGESLGIGPLHLVAGSIEGPCCVNGPCCDEPFDGIEPTEIHLEAGAVRVALAGEAAVVKDSRGRVDIESNSPAFFGPVDVRDGTLSVGSIGGSIYDYPLGHGPVTVQQPASLSLWNNRFPNSLVLAGGTLGGSRWDPIQLTGSVRVEGDSTLLAYEVDWLPGTNTNAVAIPPQDFQFLGPVQLASGATLTIHGSGTVQLDRLELEGNAILRAEQASILFEDAIAVSEGTARLDLELGSHPGPFEMSVLLSNHGTLVLRHDERPAEVMISGDSRYLRGSGTLDANLIVGQAAHIDPGGETPGELVIAGDLHVETQTILDVDLWNAQPMDSVGWDHLEVNGNFTSNGSLTIKLRELGQEEPRVPAGMDTLRVHSFEIVRTTETLDLASIVQHVDDDAFISSSDLPSTARFFARAELRQINLIYQPSLPGDANLDGQFSSADLVQVFQAGFYGRGQSDDLRWTEGDWTGDGEFQSNDLVAAFQTGAYESVATRHAVPEPNMVVTLALTFLVVLRGKPRQGIR